MWRQLYIGWGVLLGVSHHYGASICVLSIPLFLLYLVHYYLNPGVIVLIDIAYVVAVQHYLTLSLSALIYVIAAVKDGSLVSALATHHSHGHFLELLHLAPVVHHGHVVLLG